MGTGHYTLTIKMSPKSVTAFGIDAQSDEDAVGQVLGVIEKVDTFCDQPSFEVMRWDGTMMLGIARQDRPV